MKSKVKKVWNIVSVVLLSVLIVAALLLISPRLLGLQAFTVNSEAMEPTYSSGDLVYVKTTDPGELEEGDIICFYINEDMESAVRRVVSVDKDNEHVYTQGDANDSPDASPVHFDNVAGSAAFAIPLLGDVRDALTTAPGMFFAIGAVAAVLLLTFVPELCDKKKLKK